MIRVVAEDIDMTYKTLHKVSGYFCFVPIAVIVLLVIGIEIVGAIAGAIALMDKMCVKLFNAENSWYWIFAIFWVTALSFYIFSRDARYRGLNKLIGE